MYTRKNIHCYTLFKIKSLCREKGIKVRSNMRKDEVIELYFEAVDKEEAARRAGQGGEERTPIRRSLPARKAKCSQFPHINLLRARQSRPGITEETGPLKSEGSMKDGTTRMKSVQALSAEPNSVERFTDVVARINSHEFKEKMKELAELPDLIQAVIEQMEQNREMKEMMGIALERSCAELAELRENMHMSPDAQSILAALEEERARLEAHLSHLNSGATGNPDLEEAEM